MNLWVHRWASVVATLPFIVLCLTGTLLIFHDELDAALGVVPPADAIGEERVAACLHTLEGAMPEKRVLSVGIDPVGHPGVMLAVVAAPEETGFDHATLVFFELATGRMLKDEGGAGSITETILKLHAEWFLGPIGRLLGALIGALVVASLLSSLVIYSAHTRRTVFGTIRRLKGARVTQLDLHNFVGAVVVGWVLVVSVTGFLLGFSTIALAAWQYTDLARVRSDYATLEAVDFRRPPISTAQVIDIATKAARPGWGVRSVLYPSTDLTTARHYGVLLGGWSGLDARMLDVLLIDAKTGEVARRLELPAYLQAILVSEPLHFGDYGGLPLKVLWTICNLLTLFITANGAWLFFDKRMARSLERATQSGEQ